MECHNSWIRRFGWNAKGPYPALRLRARIQLWKELKREPSTAEVLEFLQDHKIIILSHREVSSALEAGEEVRLNIYFFAIMSQRAVIFFRKCFSSASGAQDMTPAWPRSSRSAVADNNRG